MHGAEGGFGEVWKMIQYATTNSYTYDGMDCRTSKAVTLTTTTGTPDCFADLGNVEEEFYIKSYNTSSMYNLMYEDTSLGTFTMLRHWIESGNQLNKYLQEYNYDALDPTGLALGEHFGHANSKTVYECSTDLLEATTTQSMQDAFGEFLGMTTTELEKKGAYESRVLGNGTSIIDIESGFVDIGGAVEMSKKSGDVDGFIPVSQKELEKKKGRYVLATKCEGSSNCVILDPPGDDGTSSKFEGSESPNSLLNSMNDKWAGYLLKKQKEEYIEKEVTGTKDKGDTKTHYEMSDAGKALFGGDAQKYGNKNQECYLVSAVFCANYMSLKKAREKGDGAVPKLIRDRTTIPGYSSIMENRTSETDSEGMVSVETVNNWVSNNTEMASSPTVINGDVTVADAVKASIDAGKPAIVSKASKHAVIAIGYCEYDWIEKTYMVYVSEDGTANYEDGGTLVGAVAYRGIDFYYIDPRECDTTTPISKGIYSRSKVNEQGEEVQSYRSEFKTSGIAGTVPSFGG